MKEIIYINTPDRLEALKRNFNKESNITHYSLLNEDKLFINQEEGLKFYIKTHGCQANIRDEESIAGLLTSLKMERTDDIKEANIVIINTCSVRENANNKVYAELGNLKHDKLEANRRVNKYKKEHQGKYLLKLDKIIILCGCMVETKDTLNHLTSTFDNVDIIFGTHNIDDLIPLLNQYIKNKGEKRIVDVLSKEGDVIEDLPTSRNNKYSAYVNISFGCDKFCTYCIVPFTRGKERSRKKEEILKECLLLKNEGYKEVILLGQNVDSYGKDFVNEKIDFAMLLESVAKLNIPRVRFLTSYPSEFKDEVIDVIAKYDNIMKFIHLPIQSGSNSVLRRMGRRYTREEYLTLVNKIKAKIPNIALSTDIIVGFPNESEEEFLDTLSLVNEVKYSSAFTFIYSPREGTKAAEMEDKISYQTKVERFKRLTKEMEVYFKDDNLTHLNKIEEVLVTSLAKKGENMLTGILENNKTVNFKGDPSLIGKLVKVKILEAQTYNLLGELIDE